LTLFLNKSIWSWSQASRSFGMWY